jgi:phospholipid transport system substrate-binding protein
MNQESRPLQAAACLAIAALCFCSLPPALAPAAEGPRAVVEATTDAVLGILRDGGLTADEKRHRIEDVVYARVDFDTLSRLVLAQNWKALTGAQRTDFVREFRRHLALTYGKNVDSYRNERVAIEGEREEARGDWTVKTKIVRGGPDDIAVDYRLRQTNGTWRIIDFIIEGVSLVSNYRSQFQEIMAHGGAGRLLDLLREKNARGEPLKS